MLKKQPTIKDIAKALDVSIATVSRALRQMPDVKEETIKKVLKYAEEIDYQPNMAATSLVKKHTKLIGVLVPNLEYFFGTAIKGIDEAAMEAGYSVIVCQSYESYGREVANLERLLNSQVEGLILTVSSETQQLDHVRRAYNKIPMVFFDRDMEGLKGSKVLLHNEEAACHAVEHLLQNGYKNIAFLGSQHTLSISEDRLKGFIKAHKKHDIETSENQIHHIPFNTESAYARTKTILSNPNRPDAIFAISDRLAIGAYKAIKEFGLAIPKQIALVGFNNEPALSIVTPTISSVAQPAFDMGRAAAKLLIEQLNCDEQLDFKEIKFDAELQIRASSSTLV